MTEIRQIENDGKNIMVNNAVQPAVFVATAAGNAVRIISTVRFITNISTQGINYESLEINGEVPASANDAVQKLNSFIGAFKSGGGGVSPEFQYSTDEQWTGKYWIDGKKIYTRVSTGTVSAAADEVVNILLQSGVSALISVSGTWNTTNGNTAIIWGELKGIPSPPHSSEYVSNLYLSGNEVWVSNHCELARTDAPYHYVLEYTKV